MKVPSLFQGEGTVRNRDEVKKKMKNNRWGKNEFRGNPEPVNISLVEAGEEVCPLQSTRADVGRRQKRNGVFHF